MLNELVKQVPEGVYITAVKQDGQTLNVAGIAQTQERVSELLRNTAYNSEWLVKPELVESKAATIQGANSASRSACSTSRSASPSSVRRTRPRRRRRRPSAAAIPAAASAPASAAAVVAKKT